MSETITIYQKPTCSTCRETIKILQSKGVPFESVNYILEPLNAAELRTIASQLQGSIKELVRTKEPLYKELGLDAKELSDDEWIAVLAEHPVLIQRPIVVRGTCAIVARPPEKIEELFED